MWVLKRLKELDPLAGVDTEALAQHPLFDELCNEIISDEESGSSLESADVLPEPIGSRPRRSRHGRQFVAVAAVLIALVGVLYVVVGSGGSNDTTTTPFEAGRALNPGLQLATPPTGSSSWQLVSQLLVTGWQQSSGPPPGQLTCPSTSACYALSASYASSSGESPPISESLYVSHDFGLTWSVLPLPTGFRESARLSCASAEDCAAPGIIKEQTVLITTTDGGHQWTIVPWKGGAGLLSDLSCTSSTTCRAIFEPLSPKPPSPLNKTFLALVREESSCTSWTACTTLLNRIARVAPTNSDIRNGSPGVSGFSELLVTTYDGGLTWNSEALPRNERLNTIACTSSANCLTLGIESNTAASAVAEKLNIADVALSLVTNNSLQVGNEMIGLPQYPLPPRFRAPVAALPSAISAYEATVEGLHLPSIEVATIIRDCQAEKNDLALNSVGKLPVNQWNNHGTALSTAQQTLIEQVGLHPFVRRTTNGGSTWTQASIPASDLGTSPLSCSSGSICSTVGSPFTTPEVLVTIDGGRTWHAWAIGSGVPGPHLSGVACPEANTCWATGSAAIPKVIGNAHDGDSALIIGTTDSGQSWSPVSLTVPANAPNYDGQSYMQIGPVTCPRENACLALGVAAQGSRTAPVYRLLESK